MAKLIRIDEFRNARYRPRWRPAEAIPVELRGVVSRTGNPVSVVQEYLPPAVIPPHTDMVIRTVLSASREPAELLQTRREVCCRIVCSTERGKRQTAPASDPRNCGMPFTFRLRSAPLFDCAILPRAVACSQAAAGAPLRVRVALPRLSADTFTKEAVFQSARASGRIVPDAPEQEPSLQEKTPTELVTVSLLPKRATRPGVVIPKLPAAGLLYLRTSVEPQTAVNEARREGPLEVRMAADGPIIRVNIAAPGPTLPDSGFLGRRVAWFDVRPACRPGMDVVGMPPHELKVPDFMAFPRTGYVTPTGRPFTLPDSAPGEAMPCGALTLGPPSLQPISPEVPLPDHTVRFRGPIEQMISGIEPADSPGAPVALIFPAVKLPEPDSSFQSPSLTSRFFARNGVVVRVPPAMQLEDVSFSSVQPRLPVRLPRASAAPCRPGVVCTRAVRPEWRSISLVEADPVRMLSKGDSLTACEYRTRSML
jgi:hypothetical protein